MLSRLQFPLIALFFVAMNVLLWRAEFGRGADLGSPVPLDLVWHRILTAPDDSALEIKRAGENIGYCRWTPNVEDPEAAGRVLPEEYEPSSLAPALSGYTIDLEGNLLLAGTRLRFALHLECSTNNVWRAFSLHLTHRPHRLEVRATAAERALHLRVVTGDQEMSRIVSFDQLRDPQALAGELDLPVWPGLLASLGLNLPDPAGAAPGSGPLAWKARTDWLSFGHSRLRVYRIEARVLDRHRVAVVISRVGEILRVELPGGVTLVNDALLIR